MCPDFSPALGVWLWDEPIEIQHPLKFPALLQVIQRQPYFWWVPLRSTRVVFKRLPPQVLGVVGLAHSGQLANLVYPVRVNEEGEVSDTRL